MSDSTNLMKYLLVEKKFIEMAKWFEGERLNKDPEDAFILAWIATSAAEFRVRWGKSVCKGCDCVEDCGHLLKEKCENYWEDSDT